MFKFYLNLNHKQNKLNILFSYIYNYDNFNA